MKLFMFLKDVFILMKEIVFGDIRKGISDMYPSCDEDEN